MRFPIEILDQFVTNGLDSFETLMSWSKIGPHFKHLVEENLGVLALWDADKESTRASPAPLDYGAISGESNTLCVFSDWFRYDSVEEFLSRFSSILVVIVTDRGYSDPLASALSELAKGLSEEKVENEGDCSAAIKNLCIIYKTKANFISKFYFRELLHCSHSLRLAELHIVGNGSLNESLNMFDLDTCFEITNLHNVEVLYTLNIRSSGILVAKELKTIKRLFIDPKRNVFEALASAPHLSNIENFQMPAGKTVRLPPCDNLTLTNFNTDIPRELIDGSHVRGTIVIKCSLKCTSSIFQRIKCPHLKALHLEMNRSIWGKVAFYECSFGSLEVFKASIDTDWQTLLSCGADNLKSISVSIGRFNDLVGIEHVPFKLTSMEFLSPKNRDSLRTVTSKKLKTMNQVSTQTLKDLLDLKFELFTLWDCLLFQNLILPAISEHSKLCIFLDKISIYQELCPVTPFEFLFDRFNACNLDIEHGIIKFLVPKVQEFKVIPVENIPTKASTYLSQELSLENFLLDLSSSADCTISPSEFRKNNLFTKSTARKRTSTLSQVRPFAIRRTSSARTPIHSIALNKSPALKADHRVVQFIFI